MNKKGFTLIELLAVIVVLAILVLLALPNVTKMITKTKVNSFVVEANEIVKVAQTAYHDKNMNDEELEIPVCFTVDELITSNYLDKDIGAIRGAVVLDMDATTKQVDIYTYLSTQDYFVSKKYGVNDGRVVFNDIQYRKGQPLYNDCTTTCTATISGEVTIMCGDSAITTLSASTPVPVVEPCDYPVGYEWTFGYKGSIDNLPIECSGYYRLEAWGAQGGSFSEQYHGGYGGYAVGYAYLNKESILYIGVGGKGIHVGNFVTGNGGYNGGGAVTGSWSDQNERRSTGGGATHIALNNNLGELKNYEEHQNDILIVAGGGGGGHANNAMINSSYYTGGFGVGGSGGGTNGGMALGQQYDDPVTARGGWQEQTPSETRGRFGQGGQALVGETNYGIHDGAGGGWYGGERSWRAAGGGSGHLSSVLVNAHMACYNCMETEDEVTTNVSQATTTAEVNKAKKDDGYVRITYAGATPSLN